jgi:hypothetical protein
MFVKKRSKSGTLFAARVKEAPVVPLIEKVLNVRSLVGFDRFEARFDDLPNGTAEFKLNQPVRVKSNPNKSGSAFSQMVEFAIFGGYLDTADGIKALVVYTERENDDGSFDYGLVMLSQIRAS